MQGTGAEFMEKTKYPHLGPSSQQRGETQPPLQVSLGEGERTSLPAVEALSAKGIGLREAIEVRRSIRKYSESALSTEDLSFLLWATQGVRETLDTRATFRMVPSAGARHPFETVLLVNRVDGLDAGLYQYEALEHRLMQLPAPSDATEQLTAACHGQGMVTTSAVTFVWVADIVRTTWRYGERGYRYIHLDAGHVCQNLYLAAEPVGAGVCAIAAFDDDDVNRLLRLDGSDRFAVYIAAVGKKQEAA